MRQLPDTLIRRALAAWERNDAAPLVCYFHVWELDPDQPRISAVSALERLRQYRNLRAMSERIRYHLDRYRFGTISEYLQLPPAPSTLPVARIAVPSVGSSNTAAARAANVRTPISVVVPCYDEEETLGYTANTLRAFADSVRNDLDVTYIFVDDGSRDGTWRRLNELFARRADYVLVRHPLNRGSRRRH